MSEFYDDGVGGFRKDDPDTSKAAAHSLTTYLEGITVADLTTYGPQTSTEIAMRHGLSRDSISPRMAPLVRKGIVEDSGLRRTAGKGTRSQIVWKLTAVTDGALAVPS